MVVGTAIDSDDLVGFGYNSKHKIGIRPRLG